MNTMVEIQCSECGATFTHMPYHFTGMADENLCRQCYEALVTGEEDYAQAKSEPSAEIEPVDGDAMAKQIMDMLDVRDVALAAARARIAELDTILDALIQDDTYRANDLETMAYNLGRYGATTASRQEDMATYIQGVIKRLKGSQS